MEKENDEYSTIYDGDLNYIDMSMQQLYRDMLFAKYQGSETWEKAIDILNRKKTFQKMA